MSTKRQSSKTDDDVTFRPLIRLSRSTHGDLIDLLEKVPPRALGYEIVRLLALSLSVEGRPFTTQRETVSTAAATEASSNFDSGEGRAPRSHPLITSQIQNATELGENTPLDEIEGFKRLGIKNTADFSDAFDWTKP